MLYHTYRGDKRVLNFLKKNKKSLSKPIDKYKKMLYNIGTVNERAIESLLQNTLSYIEKEILNNGKEVLHISQC